MKLAGFGLLVADKKASILAEYISKFMHINKNKIKEERLYSTLGWKNDYTSFVLGTEEIFKDKTEKIIISNAPTSITNAISRCGTIDGWIKSTRSLLKHDRARFKCYIACSAPILSIIDQQSRIMNDYGDSSLGKTTTNECGMSIWGHSDLLNLTALATKVGAEELVRLFCNIPVNLDDVQTVDPDLFKEVVYMVGNESGKLRGKKTGGLRDVARWKTIVFTTGEAPINDDKSLTGQKVRAIDTSGGLGAIDIQAVNEFEDGKKIHYGHIAPILIKKILNKKEEIPLLYNKVLNDLVISGNDNNVAGRLRKVFATFVKIPT